MSEMLTPLSDSRHTKAEGKFTPQICRSRIFVPANECTRVVPMYPSQSAMSHLHSLAQSMYIATFLPKHVIPTCFADYVTSTSGAIWLAFDLSPWPQVVMLKTNLRHDDLQTFCTSGKTIFLFLVGDGRMSRFKSILDISGASKAISTNAISTTRFLSIRVFKRSHNIYVYM